MHRNIIFEIPTRMVLDTQVQAWIFMIFLGICPFYTVRLYFPSFDQKKNIKKSLGLSFLRKNDTYKMNEISNKD